MSEPDLVTKVEIAAMLGVSPRTVAQWRYWARTGMYQHARSRARPLPEPVGVAARGRKLWERQEILAWAQATGRQIVDPTATEPETVK